MGLGHREWLAWRVRYGGLLLVLVSYVQFMRTALYAVIFQLSPFPTHFAGVLKKSAAHVGPVAILVKIWQFVRGVVVGAAALA